MQKILIVGLLCLVSGLLGGWILRGDHEDAKRLKSVQAGIKETQEGKTKVDAIAENQAGQQAAQATKDRIITKEVVKYVEVTPASDRCILPGAWRRLHDNAALGKPADPTGLVTGQADPVTDSTALVTVTENYIGCRGAIAQVEGWQEWWATAKNYCSSVVGP